MKIRITIWAIVWITNFGVCFGQEVNDKFDYIAFSFNHSRRIPHSHLTIEIKKRQAETIVKVHSVPKNNDKEWETSKIDKSFTIDTIVFTELVNQALLLNKTDLKKALLVGFDGTECAIEFGTFRNTVTYKFWSPDYDTKKRELTDFLKLCERLIEVAGLDPKDIL